MGDEKIEGIDFPMNADRPEEVPQLYGRMPCHLCGSEMTAIPWGEEPAEIHAKPRRYEPECFARCNRNPSHVVGWMAWGG